VHAWQTLRGGGVSVAPLGLADGSPGGLNLGEHVGDDPAAVAANRALLQAALPGPVRWLRQVHGVAVHDADADADSGSTPGSGVVPEADAAVTARPGVVLAVMTADCLPVLLADDRGRMVGVAHAGWRGLAAGVLEAAVDAMRTRLGPRAELAAWLGPAIGPRAFEVGEEVRAAFVETDPRAVDAFAPGARPGKWLADLEGLARRRLAARGVSAVAGGGACTVADPGRYWSHRRDGRSGRMASLVWIDG
jgi:YfiH family protein